MFVLNVLFKCLYKFCLNNHKTFIFLSIKKLKYVYTRSINYLIKECYDICCKNIKWYTVAKWLGTSAVYVVSVNYKPLHCFIIMVASSSLVRSNVTLDLLTVLITPCDVFQLTLTTTIRTF